VECFEQLSDYLLIENESVNKDLQSSSGPRATVVKHLPIQYSNKRNFIDFVFGNILTIVRVIEARFYF
jgi:hypothetical protein